MKGNLIDLSQPFGGPEEYYQRLKEMHAFLKEMIKDLKKEELK